MKALYAALVLNPLYNALILIFVLLPFADAGLAVIILTVLVRFLLYPLSKKAVMTQVRMQEIAPEVRKIKETFKTQEEQARKTLELYREKQVNPFSGVLVILIQLPIIFALYYIFLHAGFPNIDNKILYSFIEAPQTINTTFLGLVDITEKSAILAFLAALTTFIQLHLATKANPKTSNGENTGKSSKEIFSEDLARSMQTQMKYFFPILVFFISYSISGVIALYWLTSNIFTIGQEMVVRKKIKLLKEKSLAS